MFNLSTSGNVGYNGISQLSDVRCTPMYEGGPGGKLRAFLHSEAKAPLASPAPPANPLTRRPQQSEDIYTFRDSEPTPSQARLRVPDKPEPVKKPDVVAQRSTKHMNGGTIRTNHSTHNGVHRKSDAMNNAVQPARVTVRQNKDLFANYPNSDLRKFPADEGPESKSSIISKVRHVERKDSMYQDCQMSDAVVKKESIWPEEVGLPLFSSPPKIASHIPPRKLPSGKPPPGPGGWGAGTRGARGLLGRGPALHEALQRISPTTPFFDCGPLDATQYPDNLNNCVQPWLGVAGAMAGVGPGRAERLAARRAALRRRTTQLCHYTSSLHTSFPLHHAVAKQQQGKSKNENFRVEVSLLENILSARGSTTLLSAVDRKKIRTGCKLVGGGACVASGCSARALACAAYCVAHVASSPDQSLFSRCTAKYSDNTQCRMPVLNVTSHLPLCTEHAWKRDNYNKISQELKPKKAPRKRPKPSAMIRPQKRNRKRKKPVPPEVTHTPSLHTQGSTSSGCEESAEETGMGLSEEFIEVNNTQHIVDEAVVAQVLGLQEEEAPAPSQDPPIDLSTVFNDFFTEEQNEEYIPTREETEELERALEAVNQDVKSLEKLTESQSSALLLDALLDERALAETLANLPEVFSPSPNCTA